MEIAVVVSTFERPGLLTRCLASLAAQRGVEGRFEVVVTDDGSQDETRRLRADAIRSLPYPLSLLTSRSSVGRCVRKCHWPGYPQAGGASGTGPRAAQRPRLCRGAFGTRRPVPFSADPPHAWRAGCSQQVGCFTHRAFPAARSPASRETPGGCRRPRSQTVGSSETQPLRAGSPRQPRRSRRPARPRGRPPSGQATPAAGSAVRQARPWRRGLRHAQRWPCGAQAGMIGVLPRNTGVLSEPEATSFRYLIWSSLRSR
jgi:glycosyltransferase involved in cell wall biosynthesis